MSSERARLARKFGPWLAWAAGACTVAVLNFYESGLGSAPAIAEVRAVSLGSLEPARVVSISVKPGDRVNAGQLIARLDPRVLEGELVIARARLDELEAKVLAQKASLQASHSKLTDQHAGLREKVSVALAQLEAEAQKDRAMLTEIDSQLSRQQQLVKAELAVEGVTNPLKIERAALARKLEAWDATLARARESKSGSELRLSTVRGFSDERQLAPLYAAVVAQEAQLRLLETQRDALDLKAPFAGQVAEVLARPGESVRAGEPIVTLVDDHPDKVIAWVDQSWASQVAVGDSVQLTPIERDAAPRRGTVVALGPALAETPPRFQPSPDRVAFSRQTFVQLEPGAPPLPGQAYKATFHRSAR